MPMESDHGTHVAGTIAGYAETAEGENLFNNPCTLGNTFVGDVSMSGYINRAQLVTFLYRFAKPEGETDTTVLDRFPDGAALPEFCRESFAWAIESGLVAGMDGSINASGTANRAQLATILMRFDAMN